MGNKIFVSYKYADEKVFQSPNATYWEPTTVRDYVDLLQGYLDKSDHIYKGEDDGEDMSTLADSTIASKLGDKIFDSTVTIVFISKGMKEPYTSEKEQWIPWEVSYSLKQQSRNGMNSKTNAVLAVVLPDENGSYDYYITQNPCSRTLHTDFLFEILRENMFNQNDPNTYYCSECGGTHYRGDSSYIKSVKWDDFKSNPNFYIDKAIEIRKNINEYKVRKNV